MVLTLNVIIKSFLIKLGTEVRVIVVLAFNLPWGSEAKRRACETFFVCKSNQKNVSLKKCIYNLKYLSRDLIIVSIFSVR